MHMPTYKMSANQLQLGKSIAEINLCITVTVFTESILEINSIKI